MVNAKKLLYITRYYTDQEFHLKKKFDGQIAAFRNLGFDVYYIGLDKRFLYLIHNDERIIYGKTHFRLSHYIHTQLYNDLHKASIKAINEIGFDYVYWRYAPLWRSSCKVAETIKETGGKLLLEIPTFPPEKEAHRSFLRRLFSIYTNLFSHRFDSLIDAYVVLGEDAGGEYKGKPAINIDNGIELNNFTVRKAVFDLDTIHILALASMSFWHGYDRLIESLSQYKGTQKVKIHMVGGNEGGALSDWKELTHLLNLDDQVIFHGGLYGKELDEIINKCDLGCASLRRHGHSHVSELKTREYTARGLPFILSLKDDVFLHATKEFSLLVPNDDSIPDMNSIVAFANRMRMDDEIILYMREFAEKYLSWDKQYKKVFDTLKKYGF